MRRRLAFAVGDPLERFLTLVGRELWGATETHATISRALLTILGPRPDKVALERRQPGQTQRLDAHRDLDVAVATAYGWPADVSEEDALARLVELNLARERLSP